MSEISKQALKVDNNQSFPNNNAGAITPAILRAFNENMIDSMVDEISYNEDSASWNAKINSLDASGSAASIAALNQFTSSALVTASFNNDTRNLTFTKGDLSTFSVNIPDVSGSDSNLSALNAFTQSAQLEINALESFTASVAGTNTFTQSAQVSINALNAETASYAKTNVDNRFTTGQTITGSLVVTGTITANELHVIIESSSIIYSSGSNQLGDELSDVQILSGSTKLVGTAELNGSPLVTSAQTASYIQDLTALNEFTASVAGTNAFTASAQQSINAINAISGTWITEAESGSFIKSAGSSGTNVIQFTYGDGSTTNVTVATGSATDISALNAFTESADLRLDSLEAATSSYANSGSVAAVDLAQQNEINALIQWTSSVVPTDISALNAFTASVAGTNTFTQSADLRLDALENVTASYATTGSNVFIGNQTINGNLNLTGSLTASGLIYPIADNGEKSFIQTDGNGNLSLQYVDTIFEAFYAGESVPKGTPLYFSGSQGANPIARAADASDPNKMPVIVVANDNLTAGTTYEGIVLGLIEGIDLTGYTAGQTVYVAEGGGWSTSLPSGSNSITQVLGIVTKGGSGGKGLVLNPGPAQLPGLQTGCVWVGNASNQPVAVSTGSFIEDLTSLNAFTASIAGTNAFTASATLRLNSLESTSASVNTSIASLNGFTASIADTNAFTQSAQLEINSLEAFTASVAGTNAFTQSAGVSISALNAATASYAKTNSANTFNADQIVSGSMVVTGNLNVFGSASFTTVTSSIFLGGNTIILNTFTPSVRYGGIEVIDSGSTGLTGSLLWDSERDKWIYSNPSGSTYSGGMLISGPRASSLGTEEGTNNNAIMKGQGGDHITSSQIIDDGTTVTVPYTASIGNIVGLGNPTAFSTSVDSRINAIVVPSLDSLNNATASLNSATASLFTSASLAVKSISPTLASLQFDYVTGDGSSQTVTLVAPSGTDITALNEATASLNATTASLNATTASLNSATASLYTSASLALKNASATLNTITFTKGDDTTFNVTVNTGSAITFPYTGSAVITGSLGVTGSISVVSSSFSGAVITNLTDTYTDVAAVEQIVTLTSASYASLVTGGTTNPNTLYVVTGQTAGATIGSNTFTGTQIMSGSVQGKVGSVSISSLTASIDFSTGNFFTLNLAATVETHILPTNIQPGETVSLRVVQNATPGTVTYPPTVKFASGNAYTASTTANATDIITFVTFDTSSVYANSVKALV
jgi:hypothetical protein